MEMSELVTGRQQRDELITITDEARLVSESASIIAHLKVTRAIVLGAPAQLEGARAAQTNLADILGATRYRFYSGGRLAHVKSPQNYRYRTGAFLHMLVRDQVGDQVRQGTQAVPLLVRMARDAKLPSGNRRTAYQRQLTSETRERDAIPQIMMESEARRGEATHADQESEPTEITPNVEGESAHTQRHLLPPQPPIATGSAGNSPPWHLRVYGACMVTACHAT